jgi:hypothetical protein
MNRQALYLTVGMFLGIVLAVPMLASNFFDDAYIHARISENFLIDGAPLFNAGEKFKADSSTGYLFVISALSIFWGILDSIRYLEIAVIFITTISLFYLASFSISNGLRNIFVSTAIIPSMLWSSYGGMETSVICLLITWAAIAWHYEKHSLVMFLAAVATWFRFEAILLLLLVIFYYAYVRKFSKTILFYATPFLLLIIVELIIFGSIIPHAAKVKPIAYGYPLFDSVVNALGLGNKSKFGVFFLFLLGVELALLLRKKFKIDFPDIFLIFSVGIFISWAIGKSLIFSWYYCLLIFPLGITILLKNKEPVGKVQNIKEVLNVLVLYGFILIGLRGVLPQFGLLGNDVSSLRVKRYMDIGTELYAYCPKCSLVSSEIGGLGFSFKGKVYDAFGLGDPEAVQFHPLKVPAERSGYGVGAIPPRYIAYKNPDFIVSLPAFSELLRASSAIISYQSYDCKIGAVVFGDEIIQVFSKQVLPAHSLQVMGCESAPKIR